MRLNNRGMALLQVLIISAVLAGLSAMILRATLSRTVTARQVRRTVSAQMIIESCMAEVNALWAAKDPKTYAEHLQYCIMTCDKTNVAQCNNDSYRTYTCSSIKRLGNDGESFTVTAQFESNTQVDSNGRCNLTYTIADGVSKL